MKKLFISALYFASASAFAETRFAVLCAPDDEQLNAKTIYSSGSIRDGFFRIRWSENQYAIVSVSAPNPQGNQVCVTVTGQRN